MNNNTPKKKNSPTGWNSRACNTVWYPQHAKRQREGLRAEGIPPTRFPPPQQLFSARVIAIFRAIIPISLCCALPQHRFFAISRRTCVSHPSLVLPDTHHHPLSRYFIFSLPLRSSTTKRTTLLPRRCFPFSPVYSPPLARGSSLLTTFFFFCFFPSSPVCVCSLLTGVALFFHCAGTFLHFMCKSGLK